MRKILLIGNPNVGKSTLFNSLTKSSEHTGNFHGVTVNSAHKIVRFKGEELDFVDLPGLYSLNTFTEEEDVAKAEILKSNVCRIVVVDANSIKRNLYLCLQMRELGLDFKILINNYDYFAKKNCKLNVEKLSKFFGGECRIINAKKIKLNEFDLSFFKINNQSVLNNIKTNTKNLVFYENTSNKKDNNLTYLNEIANNFKMSEKQIIEALNGNYNSVEKGEFLKIKELHPKVIQARYFYISKLLTECVEIEKGYVYGESKMDKFLLKPIVMLPAFLGVFLLSIYLVFFLIGPFISDILNLIINTIFVNPMMNFLYSITDNIWLLEFFSNGVFSSLLTIVSFLPQVVLLFVFLTALEDSGIISRMCFVLDDFLTKFGLNGKAVYVLLLGLGCNTMATMATKNLNGKNLKIKSAIINPYISCMARLPIFVIIASAFFGKLSYFVVVGLYLLGLIVALVTSLILNKTILKTEAGELLLEFPPIRRLDVSHLLVSAKVNGKDFLKRIFGVVLSVGIIVWILTHTATNFVFTQDITESLLYLLANKISFIFAPIGLNNAGVICALFVGVMAKELIVSIFSITNNVATVPELISSLAISTSVISMNVATALSFLIFSLLYAPCMSTIAVIKKETGKFWLIFALVSQFTVAYLIAFVAYTALTRGLVVSIVIIVSIALIFTSIILIVKKIKQKKCTYCGRCKL